MVGRKLTTTGAARLSKIIRKRQIRSAKIGERLIRRPLGIKGERQKIARLVRKRLIRSAKRSKKVIGKPKRI